MRHACTSRSPAAAGACTSAEEEAAEAAAEEAAAEAAEAAAAEAERLRLEREAAELSKRMQIDAMRMQQVQAQLGVDAPAPPLPGELSCVVCMDARKQHAMVPCMHMCVCEACAQRLLDARDAAGRQGMRWTPQCPVCRAPVERTTRVFI